MFLISFKGKKLTAEYEDISVLWARKVLRRDECELYESISLGPNGYHGSGGDFGATASNFLISVK